MILLLDPLESNPFISLERFSMVMFVADNLPGNAFWKGITGSLFLGVPSKVLTLCALWYYGLSVFFHWLFSPLIFGIATFELFFYYYSYHTTDRG